MRRYEENSAVTGVPDPHTHFEPTIIGRYDFLLLRIWRYDLQAKQKEPPSRRL